MYINHQFSFDGNLIECKFSIISEAEMKIEAKDPVNFRRWSYNLDYSFFCTMAAKTDIKDPSLWSQIMYNWFKQNNYKITPIHTKKILKKAVDDDLTLVFTSDSLGKINVPVPLKSDPYTSQEFIEIIHKLQENQGTELQAENKMLQKQLYEQSQTFFVEKQELTNQIQKLQQENLRLKDDLAQKDKQIKNLKESSRTKSTTSYTTRRTSTPRSNSLVERQKQLEAKQRASPKTRQPIGPYSTTRRSASPSSRNSTARSSARTSARSSAPASRNTSSFNSRNTSRNNSVNSSRRNSSANSTTGSRNTSARLSRSPSPSNSRPSSSRGHIPLKRFDPTEWKRQRDANRRSSSPARKSFY